MSITSDEVNFLIYRYLLESGFSHSAFSFAHESLVDQANIDTSNVPSGALISYIQRGLIYHQLESHINEDGTETVCDSDFSVLRPHVCSLTEHNRIQIQNAIINDDYGSREIGVEDTIIIECFKTKNNSINDLDFPVHCQFSPAFSCLATGFFHGSIMLHFFPLIDNSYPLVSSTPNIKSTFLLEIESSGEDKSVVVNNSGDSESIINPPIGNNSITVLVWSPSGKYLSTGNYKGQMCIWTNFTPDNKNKQTLLSCTEHNLPIITLSWNSAETYLVISLINGTVIVFDIISLKISQVYQLLHQGSVLDISWYANNIFTTCGTDSIILLIKLNSKTPLLRYIGHRASVNSVMWDSRKCYMASGSDDKTIKIWTPDTSTCLHDLIGHNSEVNILRWSPIINFENPAPPILASASADMTIRLWDITTGTCLYTLIGHNHPIIGIQFSHKGTYLASIGHNRTHIWKMKDFLLYKTFKGLSGANDLSWNNTDSLLSVIYGNNIMSVIRLHSHSI